ncbi:1-(5-phosphoribosyl)-5-[(5-phosphoribosylamino)methylideneamino] imidazole-4-carboxamide isomerase [Thermotalea metallivorans]|uniref:1-(5-phosphoribosyl)-5-[(5-phosphoribosylamino)methylideneamino] imidazole-4-carboxamide isomerase n=1 Tax=Thermotalea metallivorans TaxID=520762 RepID=A0A140L9I2_9FIRM|nr:HisA/HisF-related TIM barrel protein [Thermotalea metallivorans]KXG77207.1 1-(5-phosphoribosyl)-5-[(5-phosphoribosylamino)methylideneamino] imidazole-4-carboxamide isomerase [Thermotalea metallivorans]
MLDLGVERVILGTSAVAEDGFIEKAVARFGEKIVVSIDAKNGYVAVDGWTKTSGLKAVEFAKKLEEKGLTTIIYTDIAKDGMLSGPNDAALALLKKNISMKLIASGGIGSIEDVRKLEKLGIDGAIIGKALYTGHIALKTLQEGLK